MHEGHTMHSSFQFRTSNDGTHQIGTPGGCSEEDACAGGEYALLTACDGAWVVSVFVSGCELASGNGIAATVEDARRLANELRATVRGMTIVEVALTALERERLDVVRRYFKRETDADMLRLLIAFAYPTCNSAATEADVEKAKAP